MKILIHYTTNEKVFQAFNVIATTIIGKERIIKIKNFYEQYNRSQDYLFFVVSYYNRNDKKRFFCVGKIIYQNNIFRFYKVSDELRDILLSPISSYIEHNYQKNIYYKIFTIEERLPFMKKILCDEYTNKIKLKYFDWDELIKNNKVLFEKILEILFNRENVIKLATTYNPNMNYKSEDLKIKYYSALKKIGFIKQNEIDNPISNPILHGDIGEFLMQIFVSHFLESNGKKYVYPKLIFKTNPKMPVHGNDGTIFLPDENKIYYLEAKFYKKLNSAINAAVTSLSKHNSETKEDLNHSVELFRNIVTDQLYEVLEINDNVEENLIIFVMCEDIYVEEDIVKIISSNNNLKSLKNNFEVLVFVLPVLNKEDFLDFFELYSKNVGEDYYV